MGGPAGRRSRDMAHRQQGKLPVVGYKWRAYIAIAIGLFTSVADNGSVVVALPSISQHFGTDLPTVQWVLIGYSLTISALLLPMGRLSDLIGRKRVYLTGFGMFVVAAALAGNAPNIPLLVVARVFMGVGSAMIQSTSMAIVVSAFPEAERGKALGLQMSAVGTGGVAGPALGGFIVGAFGWRGVFFAVAALGLVSAAVAQLVLRTPRPGAAAERRGFDWPGAALSSLVLVTFLLAVSNGATAGWSSPPILVASLALVALLATFTRWELASGNPMLDVRLFKRNLFTLGALTRFGSFMAVSSVRFLMPFYLQAVRGYSPQQLGLIVVPSAAALILASPAGGRLSDRYGWRYPVAGGLLVSAAGLFVLSRVTENTPLLVIVLAMAVQSSGSGIFGAPNSSSVLSTVGPRQYGVVSGFLNLARNAGNVTGIAAAAAIVAAVMSSHGVSPALTGVAETNDAGILSAYTAGLRTAYGGAALLVLMGSFFTLALRRGAGDTQDAQRQ